MNEPFPYEDIIGLPHHRSADRKHMSMIERAAQFSPFAALTGYDEVIAETGRLTDDKAELPEYAAEELDRCYMRLTDMLAQGLHPTVALTYFVPDKTKSGGSYQRFSGRLKSIDSTFRRMIFFDEHFEIAGKIIGIDTVAEINIVR